MYRRAHGKFRWPKQYSILGWGIVPWSIFSPDVSILVLVRAIAFRIPLVITDFRYCRRNSAVCSSSILPFTVFSIETIVGIRLAKIDGTFILICLHLKKMLTKISFLFQRVVNKIKKNNLDLLRTDTTKECILNSAKMIKCKRQPQFWNTFW